MRPITEPYCATPISTVPSVLSHRQQWPISFPPTELFGGERRICRPPAGMKWRSIGYNACRLRFSRRSGGCLSTFFGCEGFWCQKQIHCCTGFFTRGHKLCYLSLLCRKIDNCLLLGFFGTLVWVRAPDIIRKLNNQKIQFPASKARDKFQNFVWIK